MAFLCCLFALWNFYGCMGFYHRTELELCLDVVINPQYYKFNQFQNYLFLCGHGCKKLDKADNIASILIKF